MTMFDHTLATRVVVRVLDGPGEPVGAGFLLGPDVVATCAHVVADAVRADPYSPTPPAGAVRIDFPLLPDGGARSARVVRWLPIADDGTGDIAVLQLDAPVPAGARMPPLRRIDRLWDHPFRVLGFPEGLADGVWTTGRIRGEQGTRWFQLQASVGDQPIVGGFSGSPVWDESTGAVVGMTVAADASGATTTAYLIPIDQVLGADPELLPCPYRGLEAFDEEHADWFFGRERDIDLVAATLERHPLVTVVGPSGAGKSSLVKAGLIPRMRAAGAVVTQLRPLPGQTADQVLSTVPGRSDVLVVDQFEELAAAEPELAQLLLEGFGELVGPPEERTGVRVVLTLRSASLDTIAAPNVAALIGAGTVLLPPMDRGQLRDAIVAPAERAPGLTFEAGLVDRILDEAAAEPGHLPLVESLLTELWERRTGGALTVAAYEQAGGVAGVVATHAESVISRLAGADLPRLRRLFTSLAGPDRDGRFVRRPARIAELPADLVVLVSPLVAGRLLVVERVGEVERLQLAHQALIAHWPRLAGWLADDRDFLAWRDQLEQQRDQWEATGRDEGALLRGTGLAAAQDWLPRRTDDVTGAAREFVGRSVSRQRREVRRWRIVTAVLAVLALAAGALSVVTVISRNEIDHQLDLTNAQSLGRTALDRARTDPVLATRLALAGYRIDPTNPQVREALVRQLAAMRSVVGMSTGLSSRPLTDIATTGDGRGLLFGDERGVAVLDPTVQPAQRHDLVGVPSDYLIATIITPDEVVVVLADGSVQVWNTAAPDRPRTLAGPGSATRLVTADATRFAWLGADRRITTVDRRTGAPLGTTSWTVDPGVRSIGFTADPNLVLVRIGRAKLDGSRLELRSLADGALVRTYDGGAAVVTGGSALLTCDVGPEGYTSKGVAVLRDIVTGAEQRRIPLSAGCSRTGDLGGFVTGDRSHLAIPVQIVSDADYSVVRVVSLEDGRQAEYVLPPDPAVTTGSFADAEDFTIGDTVTVLPPTADGPTEAVAIRGTSVLRLRGVPTTLTQERGLLFPGPDDRTAISLVKGRPTLVDLRTGAVVAGPAGPEGNGTGGFLFDRTTVNVYSTTDTEWRLDRYALPGLAPAGSVALPHPPDERGGPSAAGADGLAVLLAGGTLVALGPDGRESGTPFPIASTPDDLSWYAGGPAISLRPGHPEQVAVIGPRATVTLWDLAARTRIVDLPHQDVRRPTEISFNVDGSRLVARTTDGTLDTWTLDPPAIAGPPIGIDRKDVLIGFTADGQVLTAPLGFSDGALTWWDPSTGRATARLLLASGEQPGLGERNDEVRLGGSAGGLPWSFPLDPQQWAGTLCGLADQPFTPAERDILPPGLPAASPCA